MMNHRLFQAFLIVILFCSISVFAGNNWQFDFGLGLDKPVDGAKRSANTGLMKIQLTYPVDFFRFRTAFHGAGGSGRVGSEVTAGFALYPLSLFYSTPAWVQFFFGGEGIGSVGKIDKVSKIGGGGGAFAGLDIRFGEITGMNLTYERYYGDNESIRYFVGLFRILEL